DARVTSVRAFVHSKKPCAAEPRAWTMRSGMRSWSKCVIFSRRMKSSSSVGPRRPALSELWLSPTGTPWLVVSSRAVESARTRSSGPIVLLAPIGGAPLPTLSDAFISVMVLAPTIGSAGFVHSPAVGLTAVSGSNSSGLLALNRNASASACVPAALADRVSVESTSVDGRAGPLTVARGSGFLLADILGVLVLVDVLLFAGLLVRGELGLLLLLIRSPDGTARKPGGLRDARRTARGLVRRKREGKDAASVRVEWQPAAGRRDLWCARTARASFGCSPRRRLLRRLLGLGEQ